LIAQSKVETSLQRAVNAIAAAARICYNKSKEEGPEYIQNSFRNRAVALISHGERLKELNSALAVVPPKVPMDTRDSSKAEQLMVLRASKIYGQVYKPWRPVLPTNFETPPTFHDDTVLDIPPVFEKHFSGWERPETAIPPEHLITCTERHGPTMKSDERIDLVQDAALDCSLVAGMCTIVGRTERGFPSVRSPAESHICIDIGSC
jgi:hypothetical protein